MHNPIRSKHYPERRLTNAAVRERALRELALHSSHRCLPRKSCLNIWSAPLSGRLEHIVELGISCEIYNMVEDVCVLRRSQSLPVIHFRPFNNGIMWPTPQEEGSYSSEVPAEESGSREGAGEESVIDSPVKKKPWWWWRRRSSAAKTGSTDDGRSAPSPCNRPSQQSGEETDGSGQEPGGWRARFVDAVMETVRRMEHFLNS
ncbi:hypothetical protein CDAR_264281 [Caerostris darwini]|uniref:Uncharacterized protein n=1 Tax=Caerostris darwini TaxID=1538125 RepID=A0AAV4MPZ5_9ARAC|nr:hypothetical protein CDAR_264281 [Caerostris darwini]